MLIPCPGCRANISAKPPSKPGKYTPKCPKCQVTFLLIVPEDADATVLVKPMPARAAAKVGPKAAAKKPVTQPESDITEAVRTTDEYQAGTDTPAEATGAYIPKPGDDPADEATEEMTGAYAPGASNDGPDDPTEATGAFAPKPDVDETAAHTDAEPPQPPPKTRKKKRAADPEMPDQLGGYAIAKQLGKGGMGAVYLARQLSLDRAVALKVMNPQWADDPVFLARFVREAYAAAQLNHHNVVGIYDIGEDAGVNFFSMEFVDGRSLGDLLRKGGKVEPAAAVGYIIQAARGLKFAHDRGMVHRDIKPDNMMLNSEGLVKVADLGLVKTKGMTAADDRPPDESFAGPHSRSKIKMVASTEVTTAGTAMGSPSYMAPEQCRDAAAVDHRADIYSLGCSLFALLAGRAPFQGDTAIDVMLKHVNEPPPPLTQIAPGVPKDLAVIVDQALAKNPRDRYQSMDEFIGALKNWQERQAAGPPRPTEDQIKAFEAMSAVLANEKLAKLAATLGAVLPLAGVAAGLVLLAVVPAVGAAVLLATAAGVLTGFAGAGLLAGGPLFRKAREWVVSSRVTDFVTAGLAVVLFVAGVWLSGLIVNALVAAVVGAALGAGYAFGLAGPAAAERRKLKAELDGVLKRLRLAGIEEDAVRKFAVQAAGDDWEVVYETLFGYPAKLQARAAMLEKGEEKPKHAAWRDGLIRKLDAAVEARAAARSKRRLTKLEAKRLQAEGLDPAEARAQAEDAAADLVEQGASIRRANTDRRAKVNVGNVLTRYEKAKLSQIRRPRKSPLKKVSQAVVGAVTSPRVRLILGAVLIVGGLLWVRQNEETLLKPVPADGDQKMVGTAKRLWTAGATGVARPRPDAPPVYPPTKPLKFAAGPPAVVGLFDSINPVVAGLLVLMTAFAGSFRCVLLVGASAAVVLAGHKLGLPIPDDIGGVMNPRQLVLAAGTAVGIVGVVLFGRR